MIGTVQAHSRLWLRLDRWLDRAMWSVVVLGVGLRLVVTGFSLDEAPASVILGVLAVLFPVVLLRLIIGALAVVERRLPRLVLAVGLALWAAGSATLHQDGAIGEKSFPGPAEFFFFPSYVCFAAFVLLDRVRGREASRVVWLETVLVCAAVASLTGSVIASPVGRAFGEEGLPLLLAMLFPLLGVGLVIALIGQTLLGARDRGRGTVAVTAGFTLLAIGDFAFLMRSADALYWSNTVFDVLYGVALTLLAGGACMPRRQRIATIRGRLRGNLMVAAAAVGLLTLVLRPLDAGAWFATLPAVVTLLAAGTRLTVALRDAQGAAEARHLSLTDDLTGLSNRRAMLADVEQGLAHQGPLALMLIDLDGFKEVNDSLGHVAGDTLLQQVAERLLQAGPEGSRVSRLGGDEFALMVRESDPVGLIGVARAVRHAIAQPLSVAGIELPIGASIGIAPRLADDDAVALLRRADVAMYRAKNDRTGESLYDSGFDHFSRERLSQVESLRTGIGSGQLRIWYQPQVDAATQQVSAVEALVRWEHPEHGLLPPVAFLPEARRAGLMGALSEAVVDMVVDDARRWDAMGATFTVSFNCAPPELLGQRLLPHLFRAAEQAGLPPERLLVEMTEDSFAADPERARNMLLRLRANGVQSAIDDYGTGFSSLSYLRDLPVHELKIDRSFIAELGSDHRNRVIVESTMNLAHAMGLRLVAEGVEDARTAATLVAMGVDVLQGFHIARPMPAHEVMDWVDTWHTTHARRTTHRAS